MDCNTGKLYELTAKELEAFETNLNRPLAPLTKRQHKKLTPMNAPKRKNYMRNQPCVCGSGKKFKKCCWGNYA